MCDSQSFTVSAKHFTSELTLVNGSVLIKMCKRPELEKQIFYISYARFHV
jgi:hypothetical protein